MTTMARLPCKQSSPSQQRGGYSSGGGAVMNAPTSFAQSRGYWEMQQQQQQQQQTPPPPQQYVRTHHRHHADHIGEFFFFLDFHLEFLCIMKIDEFNIFNHLKYSYCYWFSKFIEIFSSPWVYYLLILPVFFQFPNLNSKRSNNQSTWVLDRKKGFIWNSVYIRSSPSETKRK